MYSSHPRGWEEVKSPLPTPFTMTNYCLLITACKISASTGIKTTVEISSSARSFMIIFKNETKTRKSLTIQEKYSLVYDNQILSIPN
ncbi:hypothetical protein NPIL_677661 [Nephila pilipes]|uniref:Uncharacterized protein n=1 Tax=Nephila pilipes TaxID=299642 RepID=A0A8X6TXX9_NEPPI|nr:hypothetical protein NPIL_677661 [Nephila pilipes]